MKLSERDVKLILIVVMVALVALGFYGMNALNDKNTTMEASVKELETKYTALKLMDSNRKMYTEEIKVYANIYANIMDMYANGLDQEHIIMMLKSGQDKSGSWIKSASLTGVSDHYTFGEVTSTNPAKMGQKVYVTDNKGVSSTLTVTYEATYEQLKNLIEYINTHDDKNTINTVTMTYNRADELITGSMQLTAYGIVSKDRVYPDLEIRDLGIGTENIFDSETFEPSNTDGSYASLIAYDHDIFLVLNPDGADSDTVAIGTSDDTDGTKTLAVNSNVSEKVTLRITGTAGKYKISYRIGNETYPVDNYAEGADFVCGETLDLYIVSTARVDDKDSSGAKLNIINNSDLTLNYTVVGDDPVRPRLTMESVTGAINAY